MNLYVHVPFCIKKCNYCAFYSVCSNNIDWDGYVSGILKQLDYFSETEIQDSGFETVFFGGGTPSIMPIKYAEKICNKIKKFTNTEFTIEANPKTLGPIKLKDWKDLGVNRLSIGIQSFNYRDLELLGRIHTVKDSLELMEAANDLGLRTSGDFIYGLPEQSVNDIIKLCQRINESGLKHVSLYELTIEAGTKFEGLELDIDSVGMYQAIQDTLKLSRYEVSNYGDPCRHNMNIWQGGEYIGVGESAAGRIRRGNEWIETKIVGGQVIENSLSMRERAVEMVITGLRTMAGVNISKLPEDVINWSFVKENLAYFNPCPASQEPFTSKGDSCSVTNQESWSFLSMSDSGLLLLDGLLKYIIKD